MICPKCKNTRLDKSGYNKPFRCASCDGIWLMADEITSGGLIVSAAAGGPPTVNNHDSRTGICPAGHGIMLRAKVDIKDPFYLEKCTVCGGIWFDRGEWQRIVEENLVTHLGDFWSMAWQRQQRREKSREHFLELNREFLGNEVYSIILDLSEKLRNHPERSRAISLLQHELYEKR